MRRGLLVSFLLFGAIAPAAAMWVNDVEPVPIDRLIANLTRHVERDPKNANAHFVLGRVRSLAYARAAETVLVNRPEDAAPKGGDGSDKEKDKNKDKDKDDWTARVLPELERHEPVVVQRTGDITDKRVEHFREAALHLRLATELGADKAVHHLGLAWLLDSGSDLAPKLGWPDGVERKFDLTDAERIAVEKSFVALIDHADAREPLDAVRKLGPRAMPLLVPARNAKDEALRAAVGRLLTACWQDLAFDSYLAAFRRALPEERKVENFDMEGPKPITEESGTALLRLLPGRMLPENEAASLRKEVEDGVREIRRKGMFVTPVVFPLAGDAPLAALVPPGRTALFDLDGDDVVERWPWPTADAGILVWRPDPSVPVTSGRQLFGSRTWWIFWDNGYEPLAALDDDGDGRLAGAELDGICVWRDRNGDAREDEGEVVPAAEFGVAAIETRPDGTEDGVPARRRGIVMKDGSARPTYDWTPRAVPEASRP